MTLDWDRLRSDTRTARQRRGLTQRELGRLTGMTHSAVCNFERGSANLSAASLVAIAAQVGICDLRPYLQRGAS